MVHQSRPRLGHEPKGSAGRPWLTIRVAIREIAPTPEMPYTSPASNPGGPHVAGARLPQESTRTS
jgi:hypothetical protein